MNRVRNTKASKKPALTEVPLVVRADEARDVVVTGDFTGWSEDGIRLARAQDGAWHATLRLAPGEYQYRLRIDGAWRNDAGASRRVPNPFGGENDVLQVPQPRPPEGGGYLAR
jgi:1,4-alpha-glucan branching enzyme